METKTLLTIVALLLAGMLTIVLARGDDRMEEAAFRDVAMPMRKWQNGATGAHRQLSYNSHEASYQNDGGPKDL